MIIDLLINLCDTLELERALDIENIVIAGKSECNLFATTMVAAECP